MPPFERFDNSTNDASEKTSSIAADLWSRLGSEKPHAQTGDSKQMRADVSTGVIGTELETQIIRTYRDGGAGALSALVNGLNSQLEQQNSRYKVFCPAVAGKRDNPDDNGAQMIIVARNEREADVLQREYFQNGRTHNAHTRGKVLEIRN